MALTIQQLGPDALTALKIVVFGYILLSPMIEHDSSCAINTTTFHIAILIVSGAATVLDTTLGLLMIMASLIMIGSFNYDSSKKTEFSPEISYEKSSPAPIEPLIETSPEVSDETRAGHASPATPYPEEHVGKPLDEGENPLESVHNAKPCIKETYERLDFLKSPSLNPDSFVTEESLARVQSNVVSPGSLDNVYTPLGKGVYTAQGILPGIDLKGAA